VAEMSENPPVTTIKCKCLSNARRRNVGNLDFTPRYDWFI